jgi:hypothetical protein
MRPGRRRLEAATTPSTVVAIIGLHWGGLHWGGLHWGGLHWGRQRAGVT